LHPSAANCESLDVAFILENLADCHLYLGRRHLHRCLLRHLRIANARQHVGDRIGHTHRVTSVRTCAPKARTMFPSPVGRGDWGEGVWVHYQLAFTTPGISPRIAISRNLFGPSPNFRNTPRGRPVKRQRLRNRVGLESRGSPSRRRRAACRSSSEIFGLAMIASSSTRLFAYFFTVRRRFWSRLTTDVLAMLSFSS